MDVIVPMKENRDFRRVYARKVLRQPFACYLCAEKIETLRCAWGLRRGKGRQRRKRSRSRRVIREAYRQDVSALKEGAMTLFLLPVGARRL